MASLLTFTAWAADPLVERGFVHFYNLDFDESIADFQGAIALHPNDPELHNHLAQAIVFQEMCRDGALESETIVFNCGDAGPKSLEFAVAPVASEPNTAKIGRAHV